MPIGVTVKLLCVERAKVKCITQTKQRIYKDSWLTDLIARQVVNTSSLGHIGLEVAMWISVPVLV